MLFITPLKRALLMFLSASFCFLLVILNVRAQSVAKPASPNSIPPVVNLTENWKLQDIAMAKDPGETISSPAYQPVKWIPARVPGTVLTAMVDAKIYPEPLYGENNRPDKIPESLARTSYWYRTTVNIPASYAGRKIWLNFDGINYYAEIWVNGKNVGNIKGAFARGRFDLSAIAPAGHHAAIAVKISPQPNPGTPLEQTIANGTGRNGGLTAIDGPTFLSTIGWDWMPGIRDRDAGIWQKVYLSATGAVTLRDPYIRTSLPLPDTSSANLSVEVTLQNTLNTVQSGILSGKWESGTFTQQISLQPNETKVVRITGEQVKQLHLDHPKLWWPNGYGRPYLYTMQLRFKTGSKLSDGQDVTFGVREFSYTVPSSPNLTVSCNGVPIYCKGGNWGMDEAMKRIPRARLEAAVRMHQQANYTIIRNWVGQSTSEDLYELCDKYGIMIWDEFFQANPSDGPNPTDLSLYMANVREKILRYRNHCSILLWCARNEGFPPKEIDEPLSQMLGELDGSRLYQPSSTSGRGVHSGGPYAWQPPVNYYRIDAPFKTEIGSVSVPTLESVHGFLPGKDWESVNDDWAEHDFLRGAQAGDKYLKQLADRYGPLVNLPDFVRKGQLANYEAYRALYEGRECQLFTASTGVIAWMSHPAQPSFVWQLYAYDLEPNASLFAVRKACEPVHVMLNQLTGHIAVINNRPSPFKGKVTTTLFNLDGTIAGTQTTPVVVAGSAPADLGALTLPPTLSAVYFVKTVLVDSNGIRVSDNFYWHTAAVKPNEIQSFRDLNTLATTELSILPSLKKDRNTLQLAVKLKNNGTAMALLAHIQLRRSKTHLRVLPVYYSDNYVSLAPGESKTIYITAALAELKGERPYLSLDGWNVHTAEKTIATVKIGNNADALVSSVAAHDFKMTDGK